MRSSLRLQRCRPGRSVRMPLKVEGTTAGDTGAAEGATITTHTVAVEVTKEEDMKKGEAEEPVAEGGRCREDGEMALEEGEGGTASLTTKKQEVMGEEGEEEEPTKGDSRIRAFMEGVGVTTAAITRMGAGTRKEAGAVEVEGAGGEVAEEVKAEAGGGEGVRISTKEDSLNSSSNMEGSSTAKLASTKADTTPVEGTVLGHRSRDQINTESYSRKKTSSQLQFHHPKTNKYVFYILLFRSHSLLTNT